MLGFCVKKCTYVLSIAGAIVLSGCGDEQKPQQESSAPPPTVLVAAVVQKDVAPYSTFNGRIEATDRVELRARVDGFIEKRLFVEGADVNAGDLLIDLEKTPYEAQLAQIKGQITSAEGTLRLAKIEVERYRKLVQQNAASKERLDQQEGIYAQNLGELQRLQAAFQRAELDLGYTDIKSPMDGAIGSFAFSVGDYVTPASGPLAIIVSQDPMYVSFPVTTRQLLEIRKTAQAEGVDPRAVIVKLRLQDGSIYGEEGTMNFVDVQVDPTTDTVQVRASIPNPDRLLFHNQLSSVIVEQSRPQHALVIPQSVIAVDQVGPYVLVVDKNSKVEQRRIRPGSEQGSDITVIDGLNKDEKVILEGLQKVRPGQVVQVTLPTAAEKAP